MKTRIQFADFWGAFTPNDNLLLRTFQELTDVEVVERDPDILIFGDDKNRTHREIDAPKRIYFSVEDRIPNFRQCDYSLTFKNLKNPNNLRLPFYVLRCPNPKVLIRNHSHPIRLWDGD